VFRPTWPVKAVHACKTAAQLASESTLVILLVGFGSSAPNVVVRRIGNRQSPVIWLLSLEAAEWRRG
jgi:hypothetical protein